MLGLMISIGHRTGLFDTLADAPPLTSQELATRAGLNERYVREWLGAMATGRILGYDTPPEVQPCARACGRADASGGPQ